MILLETGRGKREAEICREVEKRRQLEGKWRRGVKNDRFLIEPPPLIRWNDNSLARNLWNKREKISTELQLRKRLFIRRVATNRT